MNNIESILNKYKKGNYVGEYPTVSEEDFNLLKTFDKLKVKESFGRFVYGVSSTFGH